MSQNRKNWSVQEDQIMKNLVKKYGSKKWSLISDKMREKFVGQGRTGKQCRQRWYNHLCPKINKQPWSTEEIKSLFLLHRQLGNKWTQIANHLKGRTDNSVKNQYYSTLRKGLRRMYRILGSQNSTTKIKKMKPKDLSDLISNFNGLQIEDEEQANQFYHVLFELANEDKYLDLQSGVIDADQRDRLVNIMERFIGIKQKSSKNAKSKDIPAKRRPNSNLYHQEEVIYENVESENLASQKQLQDKSSNEKFNFQIDFESQEKSVSIGSPNENDHIANQEKMKNTYWYPNLRLSNKIDSITQSQQQDCLTKMLKKSSSYQQGKGIKFNQNECHQNLYDCFFAASPVSGLQLRIPLSSKQNYWSSNGNQNNGNNEPDKEFDQILRQVKNKVDNKLVRAKKY